MGLVEERFDGNSGIACLFGFIMFLVDWNFCLLLALKAVATIVLVGFDAFLFLDIGTGCAVARRGLALVSGGGTEAVDSRSESASSADVSSSLDSRYV